jgi:serine/threonine-protein kinase
LNALASRKNGSLVGLVIEGSFRIEARIGEGATGVVYEARQLTSGTRVAVKVIHRELQSQLAFVSRFHVVARGASAMAHENAARVLHSGVDAAHGFLYICTEYLEGPTLASILRTGAPLRADRAIGIALQLLAALGAAHKLGILHRDLRPQNVVIQQAMNQESRPSDLVKVTDFGIGPVSYVEGTSGAAYLAPEHAAGGILDARSDVYSAGAILSQMLTGRLPTSMSEPPLPANVDPELAAVCLRATSPSPEERYRSARRMQAALRETSAFRHLAARDGQAEASSSSSIPPTLHLVQAEERRQGLHVSTPFVVTPVGVTAPAEEMETRRPPPMLASVPPVKSDPSRLGALSPEEETELQSRRAATGASYRRAELAAKRKRRTLVAAAIVLVVGGLVIAFGWRHPSTTSANVTAAAMTTSTESPEAPAPVAAWSAAPPAAAAPELDPSPTVTATTASSQATSIGTVPPTSKKDPRSTVTDSKDKRPAAPEPSRPAGVSTPVPSSSPLAPPATAPITPVAPTPPAVSMAAPPTPPPFQPEAARVDVVKTESDRVNAHAVNEILRHANIQRCYVDALKRAGAPRDGTAVLTLSIDESRVASSDLRGVDLPGLSSCVSSQLAGARVADADTGAATASVTLRFSAQ